MTTIASTSLGQTPCKTSLSRIHVPCQTGELGCVHKGQKDQLWAILANDATRTRHAGQVADHSKKLHFSTPGSGTSPASCNCPHIPEAASYNQPTGVLAPIPITPRLVRYPLSGGIERCASPQWQVQLDRKSVHRRWGGVNKIHIFTPAGRGFSLYPRFHHMSPWHKSKRNSS